MPDALHSTGTFTNTPTTPVQPTQEFDLTDQLATLRLEPGESIALSSTQLKQLVDLPPEVLNYMHETAVERAEVQRRGDLDYVTIDLQKPTALGLDHPRIKRVRLDDSIEFTAEHTADGMIEINNIKGVVFEVSRFLPKIVPLKLEIEPDGDLQVTASVMGASITHQVALPAEARNALTGGLDYLRDFKRKVLALNQSNVHYEEPA